MCHWHILFYCWAMCHWHHLALIPQPCATGTSSSIAELCATGTWIPPSELQSQSPHGLLPIDALVLAWELLYEVSSASSAALRHPSPNHRGARFHRGTRRFIVRARPTSPLLRSLPLTTVGRSANTSQTLPGSPYLFSSALQQSALNHQ